MSDTLDSKSRALVRTYDFAKDGYEVFEEINSGSFARVYRGLHKKKEQVAIKIMDLTKTTKNFRTKLLPMELIALRTLSHPYIIKLLDIYYHNSKIYIFMELADNGNLIEYVLKYGAVAETKARLWFAQICSAVIYMQNSCLLAHRDLKCDNVLLHQDSARLTDFSLVCRVRHTTIQVMMPENPLVINPNSKSNISTRQVQRLATTFCGSPAYVAPEILLSRPYDPFIADCWSLGIILYVMLNNALPFDDSDLPAMIANQLRNKWSFNNRVQPYPSSSSRQLIRAMLQPKPSQRYGIEKIMNHPWLRAQMREVQAFVAAQEQEQQQQIEQQQQQLQEQQQQQQLSEQQQQANVAATTAPATTAPATTAPATTAPATTAPATTAPATTAPATTAPATTAPATAVPATAVPATAVPEVAAPEVAVPVTPATADISQRSPVSPTSANNIPVASGATQGKARTSRKYAAEKTPDRASASPAAAGPKGSRVVAKTPDRASASPTVGAKHKARSQRSSANLKKVNQQQPINSPAGAPPGTRVSKSQRKKQQASANKEKREKTPQKDGRSIKTAATSPKQHGGSVSPSANSKKLEPKKSDSPLPVAPQVSKASVDVVTSLKSRSSFQSPSPGSATSHASDDPLNYTNQDKKQ